MTAYVYRFLFFFQAEDGIRDIGVTGVQTCALPIWVGVLVREARVPIVAELGQDHEDPVGLLPRQLDVLVLAAGLRRRGPLTGRTGAEGLADLDDGAAVLPLGLGAPADDVAHGLLAQLA